MHLKASAIIDFQRLLWKSAKVGEMATVGVDHNGQLNARMHSVATGTKPSGKTGGSFPADEGETEERGGWGGGGGGGGKHAIC